MTICQSCGRQWDVKRLRGIVRDKDSIDCTCGTEIIRWNGGVTYSVSQSFDAEAETLRDLHHAAGKVMIPACTAIRIEKSKLGYWLMQGRSFTLTFSAEDLDHAIYPSTQI
jgi:hypothetical protein